MRARSSASSMLGLVLACAWRERGSSAPAPLQPLLFLTVPFIRTVLFEHDQPVTPAKLNVPSIVSRVSLTGNASSVPQFQLPAFLARRGRVSLKRGRRQLVQDTPHNSRARSASFSSGPSTEPPSRIQYSSPPTSCLTRKPRAANFSAPFVDPLQPGCEQ